MCVQAAIHFSNVDPELGNSFDDILSGQDVAVYGALSALAALDRKEIRDKCLSKSSFIYFLESMPQVFRSPFNLALHSLPQR